MGFRFFQTEIEGVIIIEPHQATDNRGIYKKSYEKNIFFENGIRDEFTENSLIYSHKGVIRGLHYQSVEPQAKLLQVVAGSIYDVAVDLRKESATYGRCFEMELTADSHKMLYIPARFAHGFQALEEGTLFFYLCSGRYIPSACNGIFWNDKDLNISWPIKDVNKVILSDKDQRAQSFVDYCEENH